MKIRQHLNILTENFSKTLVNINYLRMTIIKCLFLGTIIYSFSNNIEAAPSTHHTYSASQFHEAKRRLDKDKVSYKTATKQITTTVHYVLWGPFYKRKTVFAALKKLKDNDLKYKLIKKGRYIFLGKYLTNTQVDKLKSKLEPLGSTNFKIVNKKKKITRYTIVINNKNLKPNTNEDDVIILSSPPPDVKKSKPIMTAKNNFTGNLLISDLYFYKTQKNLTQVFTQPTYAITPSSPKWDIKLGASVNVSISDLNTIDKNIFEPHESYLTYNKNSTTMTLGYQVLSWGRVFENSIIDRFNRQNLHLGPQLNLNEKSLSQLAFRLKYYFGESSSSLDFIYIPIFKASSLPEEGKAWSPINKKTKRIIGVPPNPIIEELVSKGSFGNENVNQAAYGIRLKTSFYDIETGLTIIQSPPLIPYYQINQETIAYIGSGQTVEQAIASSEDKTFIKQHPNQKLFALDFSKEIAGTIYRFEIGHKNNVPVTATDTFNNKLIKAIEWNLSAETYPRSGKDTLNIMLSGLEMQVNKENVLDNTSTQYIAARYLIKFARDTFETSLKARIGLHETDLQILPEVSYLPIDNHIFTFGLGYFQGANKSIGGFYNDHSYASIRWKYIF